MNKARRNIPAQLFRVRYPCLRIMNPHLAVTQEIEYDTKKGFSVMKKVSFLLALCLALSLTACGSAPEAPELHVFAASSLTESLDEAIRLYSEQNSGITVVTTYDSSGTLLTQIENGAECGLFLSAAQKQMNALEEQGLLLEGSRLNLLENKVTLAVPEGNPAGIESFDQLAELLKDGDVMLAVGNSDVPVGQYTQKIFAWYGIDEAAVSGKLTYASNAKEVTTQISEAAVDCGIIYGTDAFSAGLTVVDSATAEMCGQVLYPAAVLSGGQNDAALDFLAFLQTDEALACFEAVGFFPMV